MSKYCNHCMTQLETEGTKCPVCGKENTGSVPAHHLLPSTVLNGKFYVGTALGEGGFGITYIGRDIKLDMKVAIKEFYPNGYVNRSNTTSPQVNDSVTEGRRDFFEKGKVRFLKEAQILAKFSGEPGVVDVRDFFEENNTAYIIMEFLDGVDLKTYLKEKGTLTPEHTIQLLMPIMNSLKKVHSQGLIHRDISPDNIMVIGDKVKLLDFGAARTVSAEANKSLSVMLKPGYAPEEQYRSKGNQGPWTDIYALCATMYKCITGITPDDATQRLFSDEVKTPSALNVHIKPEIEKAIMRGMSVHQNDRYQCIEDLIRGLQGIDVVISQNEQTAVVGNNVFDDDKETVFIQSEDNEKTVLEKDDKTSFVRTNSNNIPESDDVKKPIVQSKNDQDVKKKSRTGIIIAVVIIVLIIAVVVLLIVSIDKKSDKYSNKDKNQSISIQTPEKGGETEDSNSDNVEEPAEISMSDNLFDFTFKLNDVVYKLPCKYEDFNKNGWTISSRGYSSDTKISGNSYDSFYMMNDGAQVLVYVYNKSGNAKTIKECKIGGIEVSGYNEVDFAISKDISINSSVDQIKNAFGTASYSKKESEYSNLTYYAKEESSDYSVTFYCYDDIRYSSIKMKNFIETDDDKTTTNTELPDYIKEYKKPTTMGSDLKSSIVKISGNLYQLPAPLNSFVENGWEITHQSAYLTAGATDYITVEKDGQSLNLGIVNYAEYQTTPINCAVYSVSTYNDESVSFAIGSKEKSISIGVTKNYVESIITDDFSFYESNYTANYSYSEYKDRDFTLSIVIDKEFGLVSEIRVTCKTWNY